MKIGHRFLIFLFPVVLFSCETDLEKVNLLSSIDNLPVETTMDAEILYSDSAKVKMKLTAPVWNRYAEKNPRIELPKGVHIILYEDSLTVKSTLTANYAVRYEEKKLMEANGNVIVVNERGECLNTEHLIWNEASRKIYTKEFVKITTADEVIFGDGLESNEDFSKYKITNIKGRSEERRVGKECRL